MPSLPIQSVLFDLDGTLLDTAPDLIDALNRLRTEHDLPALPLTSTRWIAGLGSKAMVKYAFSIEENNKYFNQLRERFIVLYEENIASATHFFPQIEPVLQKLDEQHIPWGIVTNKLTRHTLKLLQALHFDQRPACIICGDSLPTSKPDPGPILHACQLLHQDPKNCLYIGDAMTDVYASKAAGTTALVALYGYIQTGENPHHWGADGYISEPNEIMDWVVEYPWLE